MLVALVVILLLMWLLGVSFAASVGSFIHLLLVVVILVVFRLVRGQSLSL
ncbi:TPA: lmo0937 family membrane protein [Candidatus Micrarchaeota archaeon]|nr:lmo0937 family membrane protein [Candidatus Micrarchaeota archaeon]